MILSVKKKVGARLPTKAHDQDLGFDLYANHNAVLYANGIGLVRTGIFLEFPIGYGGLIKDRSSMAIKGIQTVGGVIDESYRGEIIVMFQSLRNFEIKEGDKIAQLVLVRNIDCKIMEVTELRDTVRGDSGFGSSGA